MKDTQEAIRRFWARVNKGASCWEWAAGTLRPNGYGVVSKEIYGTGLAHRLSWMLHFGEIPSGMLVCHKCNNKKCVNPSHLYLGDQSRNMKDAWRDGLGNNGNTIKKNCPRCGGPFTLERKGRWRECAPCAKLARSLRNKRYKETLKSGERDMAASEDLVFRQSESPRVNQP